MSIRRMLAVTACALAAVTAAPAPAANKSPQKSFGEPKPDQALVYLIREGRFQGSGRTMFVYADEQFLGTLDNNSYTFADVAPGEHLLWLNWAKINKPVTLEAGKTYYFNLWGTIDELDEATAKAFIDALESYATPAADEVEKSAEHIRERYGKAQQVAAKKPKDEGSAKPGKQREEHIAAWPKSDLAGYGVLCIEDFAMTDPKAGDRKKSYLIDTAPKRLADLVARNLGTDAFGQVLRNESCAAADGAAVLRGRFTQYKPGSETARFIVAGAGSAQLEMELELTGGVGATSITRLPVDRTWAWGGALGASRGIEEMEKNLALELATYLRRSHGETAPEAPPEPAPET